MSVNKVSVRQWNCVIILGELMISIFLLPVTRDQFLVDSQSTKYAVT